MADIKQLKQINEALEQAVREKQMMKAQAEKDRQQSITELGQNILQVLHPLLEQIAEKAKVPVTDLREAIGQIKVEAPKIPEIKVKVPDIKIPDIKVPEVKMPKITVPKPEVKVDVKPPKIPPFPPFPKIPDFPEEVSLKGVDNKSPLPVMMMGGDGKPMMFPAGGGGGGNLQGVLSKTVGFGIGQYDHVTLSTPTNESEVWTFRKGGSSATPTRQITITYVDETKATISTVSG